MNPARSSLAQVEVADRFFLVPIHPDQPNGRGAGGCAILEVPFYTLAAPCCPHVLLAEQFGADVCIAIMAVVLFWSSPAWCRRHPRASSVGTAI